MSELYRVFDKAADIVDAGWIKHKARSLDGTQHCLLDALYIAGEEFIKSNRDFDDDPYELCNRTGYIMRTHVGMYMLSEWNDSPERTKEEVVNELRACARKVESE